MFKRHPEPEQLWCRWWPAHVGMAVVVGTIVAVTIVVTVTHPNQSEAKRRVVVSFMDKDAAKAARDGPTLKGTEIVPRNATANRVVLRLEARVSDAEVVQFYGRAVLVEADPMMRTAPAVQSDIAPVRTRNATVAVIDGSLAPGGQDFVSSACSPEGRAGRDHVVAATGAPALTARAMCPVPTGNGTAEGYASDIADAIEWVASAGAELGVRVVLLAMAHKGACPSYMQTAVARATSGLGALVVAAAGDGGDEHFPSNCDGVFSVADTRSAAAHVAMESPNAAARVAGLAAGLWPLGGGTAKAVRALLSEGATPCTNATCRAVYGRLDDAYAGPSTGASTTQALCPIDTYTPAGGPWECRACPKGTYAGRNWTQCRACPKGGPGACSYDCLTCGPLQRTA